VATVSPTIVWHGYTGVADLYEWSPIAEGDTVAWARIPIKADKSVHVFGDFGGTVTIQGSNEDTPTNPVTLTAPDGVALTFTAVGLRSILQPVMWIRPSPGAGVANTTVRLLAVRP
jgi:hypothetical protein